MFALPRGRALTLACLTALALTPAADAAVRIGPDVTVPSPPNTPPAACVSTCVAVAFSAPAGVVLDAPGDGVVTAVEYRGGYTTTRVRVFRTDGASATFVRSGQERTSTGAPIRSFAERLPIRAGERIALESPAGADAAFFLAGSVGRIATPIPADDTTVSPVAVGPYLPMVSAVIEPDADRDGYGDETQDRCPNDPAVQAACPVEPVVVEVERPVPTVTPGPTVTQTIVAAAPAQPGPVAGAPVVARNRRTVSVPVSCPATRAAPCRGTVELRTAGALALGRTRVAVQLGAGGFSGRPGTTSIARIALSAGARSLLTPRRRLATVVVLRPVDAAATSKRAVLRLPKSRG